MIPNNYIILNKTKPDTLEVECPQGHIFKRTLRNFKSGAINCPECERQDKINYLHNLGFEVMSENIGHTLEVKCSQGHIFKRSFSKFKEGSVKCPKCYKDRVNQSKNNILRIVESNGYTIIHYDGYSSLQVKCKNNHRFERSLENFKKGFITCPECERQDKIEYLNSLGFTPISENLGMELEVKCLKGHTFKRAFNKFKDNIIGCPECEKQDRVNYLNKLGFTVVSVDNPDSLEVKCKSNHTFKRNFWSFKDGITFCPECEKQDKVTYLHSLGFTPISENLGDFLEVKCSKGHLIKRSFSNFKRGTFECPMCRHNKKVDFLKNLGFEIISENTSSNLEVKCLQGHTFKRSFGKFKEGRVKCPICYPTRSQFELDVEQYLPSPQINVFGVIPNYELDFYLPKYNLAIECNGRYWHSVEFKDKNYHLHKYNLCKEKGIRLIQIPESEWHSNKEWFISLIKCYLENGDFSQFIEGDRYNRMYVSELVMEGQTTKPELVGDNYKYYNCGYILRKS